MTTSTSNVDFLHSLNRFIECTTTGTATTSTESRCSNTDQVLIKTLRDTMEELESLFNTDMTTTITTSSSNHQQRQSWSCRQILSYNNTTHAHDNYQEQHSISISPQDVVNAVLYGMRYASASASASDKDNLRHKAEEEMDHDDAEDAAIDFNRKITSVSVTSSENQIQILSATLYTTLLTLPGSTASGMAQADALHTLTKVLNTSSRSSTHTLNKKRARNSASKDTLYYDLAEYVLKLPTRSFMEWSLHNLEIYLDVLVKCMCIRGGDKQVCEAVVEIVMQESASEENRQNLLLIFVIRVLHPMLGKSYALPVPNAARLECTLAACATLTELTRRLSEQEESRLDNETITVHIASENPTAVTDANSPVRTVQFHQTPKSTGRRRSTGGIPPLTSPKITAPTPSRRSALKARSRYTPGRQPQAGYISSPKPRSQLLTSLTGILHHIPLLSQHRAVQCDISLKVLSNLPVHEVRCYIVYLCNLARCNKSKWRLFAVELLSAVLLSTGDGSIAEVLSDTNLQNECLTRIVTRGDDKIPSIRTRTWTLLSQILPQMNVNKFDLSQAVSTHLQDTHASVRRAAILCVSYVSATYELVQFLPRMISHDTSISVRKTAAEVLTNILLNNETDNTDDERATNNGVVPSLSITALWVQAIPSLLQDNEASVQAKATKLAQRTLLEYSQSWHVWSKCTISSSYFYDLGVALVRYCNSTDVNINLMQVLRAARNVVDEVSEGESMTESIGAWHMIYAMLDAVSGSNASANDVRLTRAQTRKVCANAGMTSSWLIDHASPNKIVSKYHTTARRVALHILALSYTVDDEKSEATALRERLFFEITSFTLPFEDTRGVLRCLVALTPENSIHGSDNTISCIYKAVQGVLTTPTKSVVTVSRAAYTLGEVALLHYNTTDESLYSPPQALITQIFNLTTVSEENLVLQAYTTLAKCALIDSKLAAKIIPQLITLLQCTDCALAANLASNAIILLSDLAIRYTSVVDRYVKVMASCLQYGMKSYTLEQQNDKEFDNTCNRVRSHAILTLLGLLRADYIKPRKCVLYRMFFHLTDKSTPMLAALEDIVCTKWPHIIGNSVVEVMMVYNGYLHAAVSAVEDDVYDTAEDCTVLAQFLTPNKRTHIYRALIQTLNSEQRLQLSARIVREVLQEFMQDVNQFEDEDEVHCTGLGQAMLDATSPAYGVVEDALCLLMDPMLLMSSKTNSNKDLIEEDEDIEEGMSTIDVSTLANTDVSLNTSTMSTNTTATHQHHIKALHSRLITKCTLRHVLDTTVPLLCQIKHTCETHKSPLLRHVMRYLMIVFQRWKNEARETLAVQPDVLAEIIYDLKRLQRERTSASAVKSRHKIQSVSGGSKKNIDKENENVQNMRQPDFSVDA